MTGNIKVIVIILLLTSCSVQNEFTVSVPSKRPAASLETHYYVLPQTVLKVSLEAVREIYIPGPYREFAGKYLGISEIPGKRHELFDIHSAWVEYLIEPDPDMYFSINLLKGKFQKDDFLTLSSHGFVLDPSKVFRKHTDYKSTATVHAPPYFTDLSITGLFREVTDTLYKTIITDTSFVRLPIPRRQREVKTLEQRAEEAANFILELRRTRLDLISGEIDGFPGGEALSYAVDRISRLENEYMELFTGKRIHDTQVETVFIVPDGSKQEILLFRISDDPEIKDGVPPEGIPVFLKIKPLQKLKNILQEDDIFTEPVKNNLIYRIPDMALFSITGGSRVYYEERSTLFQAGKIIMLPSGQ